MSIAQDVEQVRKGRYVVYTNVGTTVFDVLRDEVPLNLILEIDKQGKALCVAHDEDTASLHVYEDHVHCYGCGFHGDVVNVWQAKKSIRSSLEAARDLPSSGVRGCPSRDVLRRLGTSLSAQRGTGDSLGHGEGSQRSSR